MRGGKSRKVRRGQLGRSAAPATLFVAGFLLLVMALGPSPDAGAAQLLDNGDFEGWDVARPTRWSVSPAGSAAPSTSTRMSGSSARLTGASRLTQSAPAVPGATYLFTVFVATDGGPVTATARVQFLDDGYAPVDGPSLASAPVAGSFVSLSVGPVAPPGTAFVEVQIASSGPILYVDNASLQETLPPPTATPTPAATATPTDVPAATSTPASSPGPTDTAVSTALPTAAPTATEDPAPTTAGQPSPGSSKTATRTPTSTRTATPPHTPTAEKTPTATRTPTPPKAPTAAKTSTAASSKPSPTMGTAPQPSGFGGLVVNGDFENEDGGRPEGWSKYGGTMGLTNDAHGGDRAATLESDTTSTKWLYQVVTLEGGRWYIADGFVRVEGGGEAFIRLSWYASDDGSGIAIDQADSDVVSGASWTATSTGAVQSPPATQSARLRLMLRPASAARATAVFDDVELIETGEPDRLATPAAVPPVGAATPAGAAVGDINGSTPPSPPAARLAVEQPAAGSHGAFRLSEILSDPIEPGRDSAFEWVELVNIGLQAADTAGWRIGDGKEQDALPPMVVPAGGYIVIAGRSVNAPPGILLVRVADGEIGNGLNNGGDVIRLFAPDGSEADAVSFGDNISVFDPAPPAPPTGITLGVRSAGSDPDPLNWAVTEHPTPGEANVFATSRPGISTQAGPGQGNGGPGATSATIIVERGGGGSGTLWLIGLLFLGVLGLGAYVLRDLPGKLKRRSP